MVWVNRLRKQIIPYINGVNSVRIISILADVELSLAYKAIRHLLYYGCVFLLDIFSFAAIYAPTAQFSSTIACDEGMQQECARYINTRFAPTQTKLAPVPPGTASSHSGLFNFALDTDDIWPLIGDDDDDDDDAEPRSSNEKPPVARQKHLDGVGIVELYASLRQGQSVKQWYAANARQLANVDVRRFITFGIIKGFLYRVHKYAYGPRPEAFKSLKLSSTTTRAASVKGGGGLAPSMLSDSGEPSIQLGNDSSLGGGPSDGASDEQGGAVSTSFRSTNINTNANTSNNNNTRPESTAATSYEEEDESEVIDKSLEKYLDGQHCFDEICTELEIAERDLSARLKRIPWPVHIIHR